jgi:hypothetical protein
MTVRHYSLYLDDRDPDDAQMIRYLDRYVGTRRAAQTIRRALWGLVSGCIDQPGRVQSPFQFTTPPPATPIIPVRPIEIPTGGTTALDRAKRSFK